MRVHVCACAGEIKVLSEVARVGEVLALELVLLDLFCRVEQRVGETRAKG